MSRDSSSQSQQVQKLQAEIAQIEAQQAKDEAERQAQRQAQLRAQPVDGLFTLADLDTLRAMASHGGVENGLYDYDDYDNLRDRWYDLCQRVSDYRPASGKAKRS